MLSLLRNEEGMTLIELLVVCVILGIAFLGLAGIFPLSVKNLNQSRMRTVATDLAQQKMEELVRLKGNDADLTAGAPHDDPDNPVRTTFNRYWTVTDDTPMVGMKKIMVRVTYPRGTDLRDVQIETYITI
ncbi:MAG: prepilin-type N-terminal cleavage/methylation domain-containing protein [Candidatus Eisenbacteria bacterium]